VAEILPVSLPPQEAVEYFRRKGLKPSFAWQDVYAEEHARVFTVAKVAKLDLLEDLRGAVDRAIAEGTTFADFKRELIPVLQEKGWWGRGRQVDPADGEEKDVQLGSVRRLRTIYDTNLRTAHAAGRWEQVQRTKARRPYLRYVHLDNANPRKQHQAWHGRVLPVDDPFWTTAFPPNGWGCHCSVQQLSDRDLERYGYTVAPSPGEPITRAWQNPRTGEIRHLPVGIEPGFDHNPGVAGQEVAARLLGERLASVSADLGAAAWAEAAPQVLTALERGFARWAEAAIEAGAKARGEIYPVGAFSPRTLEFLRGRGHPPVAAGITIGDRQLLHLLRDAKQQRGTAASTDLALRLPTILARPRAVLWDKVNPALLYVYDVPGEARLSKWVVRVNQVDRVREGGKRTAVLTNSVRTAGLVERRVLTDTNTYDVVEGAL
jgi:SPP1 gp7 family putative phage head morphogenesis protein